MTPLRLLLDQMIDNDVATDLRAAGHNICTVSELKIESLLFPFLHVNAEREFSNRLVIVSSRGVRWIQTGTDRPADNE